MEYEDIGLLHEIFRHQASLTPDSLAVVSVEGDNNGRNLTFSQLDELSDLLAVVLQDDGASPERIVAICLDKGVKFVVSYIAILKTGAAYLPLDTAYPTHLMESVLVETLPVVIITSPTYDSKLNNVIVKSKKLVLGAEWMEDIRRRQFSGQRPLVLDVNMDSLAYIVYTSGTTGKPKGILCPHRGAVFSYTYRHEAFPYETDDRETCNIFFVWEMLRPLLKGIPLYPIPNTVIYDPQLLSRHVYSCAITRMLFTPSLLETLLNSRDLDLPNAFVSMRQIWFCGEVVTTSLLKRGISKLPWVRFVNLYSVSECHDVACIDLSDYYEKNKESLSSRKFCPAGKVLPGVSVVIMSDSLTVLPIGCSGEIYVGGPTLARGYLNRPEIEAERFIVRPDKVHTSHGERLYRTGDCGYLLADGCLEIHGRMDTMVKVRGYSVEVQAIESALLLLPMVSATVVIVMGEEGEDKYLVAYVVKEKPCDKKEIRELLKLRLPFYMVPSYFVFLDSIPVLPASGKLDKKSLPPIDRSDYKTTYGGSPTTAMEEQVSGIWKDVLCVAHVDVHESFFDMGGHSLLASEVQHRVKEAFNVHIAVRDLFSYPSVALLSRYIETARDTPKDKALLNTACLTCEVDLAGEVEKYDQFVMDLDIQLRAYWRSVLHKRYFRKGHVLLTGATGFLGAFLLREMLLNSQLFVYCLVRDLPNADIHSRLENKLKEFEILPKDDSTATEEEKIMENLFRNRVITVKGNIALVKMGLSNDDYQFLTTDTDFVVHAAATVNFVYPYSLFSGLEQLQQKSLIEARDLRNMFSMALHGPNVVGTANVIVFASTGKVKPVHYISTNGVFPHGRVDCCEDDHVMDTWPALTTGYFQSKWVAEQLIFRAGERGLPVRIYRLGNLSGDLKNAAWNPRDFTLLLITACARKGVAPITDWQVEMTPVDFAAYVIVRLIEHPDDAINKILHIVNDQPWSSCSLFRWMNAHGYRMTMLPFAEWRQRMLLGGHDEGPKKDRILANQLSSVLESYVTHEEVISNTSTYGNEKFKAVLTELGVEYPYFDATLFEKYCNKLSARNLLPRPLNSVNRPLSGHVAIVTGASSGIGAAISVALASSGVSVAMAARREDLLLGIEKRICDDGGVAISVRTDITDRLQVQKLVLQAETCLGDVSILVNCAGVMYYTMMKNLHQDQWDRTIDVNCKGTTNCVAAVLAGMVSRGAGHIVNITSDAGRKGFPGLAVYSGSKFFIEGFSQAMRVELADSGVKVTCVQPGDVDTPLQRMSTDVEAVEKHQTSSSYACLQPDDVARAVLFAVSAPDHVAVNEILVEPRLAPL